ncbi:MAG: polysaccharide deacetylase family protein [Flavobacteriaceae bacterium]|nr:polysaccharide deacetylase family protein [Flavobacteriaceae bacterium]
MKLVTPPKFVRWLYPNRVWEVPQGTSMQLTFDDGPIPEVTPWVLDLLKAHNVKASFFCIGDNVRRHPAIFKRIVGEGHRVGNHTHNHLNGWKTDTETYLNNALKAARQMDRTAADWQGNGQKLFRPPYGRLTSRQATMLREEGYEIVMWSILSYDFDTSETPEGCYNNIVKHLAPGKIVVFHDSLKAEKNLRHVLPKIVKSLTNNK